MFTILLYGVLSLSKPVADTNQREELVRTVPVYPVPEFPGGHEAMMKFIANHLRYPTPLLAEFEGTLFVQFTVDKKGNVLHPHVVGPPKDSLLEKEAVRVIKLMPRWKPGTENGKPVAIVWNVPIRFRIEE
jgi:protein TonB